MDNQIQNLDSMFEDVTWEDENTTPEQEEHQEEVQESPQEQAQPFDFGSLEIKGLKGSKKLAEYTPEEIRERMQKGDDYDRIRESHEKLKQAKEIAKLYGMEIDDMLAELKNNKFREIAETSGTSEDYERKRYELEEKERILNQQLETTSKQTEREKMIERFVEENPGITVDKIPKEVLEAVKSGEDINTAFMRHENKLMREQMLNMQRQIENIQKAPVTPTTSGGTDEQQYDDFLAGFWGK